MWCLLTQNQSRQVLAQPEPLWSLHFHQSITADLNSKGNNSKGLNKQKKCPNLRLSAKLITQAWQVIHHVPHYQLGIQNKIRIKTASAFPSGIFLFSLILKGFLLFFCTFLFVKIYVLKSAVYVLKTTCTSMELLRERKIYYKQTALNYKSHKITKRKFKETIIIKFNYLYS